MNQRAKSRESIKLTQCDGIQHAIMKEARMEYYRRITIVPRSELSAFNRLEAIT